MAQHLRAAEDRAHAEVDRARQEARDLNRRAESIARALRAAETSHSAELDALRWLVIDAQSDASSQRVRSETLEAQLAHLRNHMARLESALTKAKPTRPGKRPPKSMTSAEPKKPVKSTS